jgi:hypothetical protein
MPDQEGRVVEGLTPAGALQYHCIAGPVLVGIMTHAFITRSLAVLLVLCILVVGGIASAQAITHESQHSHHQKAHHGTVLCSWMCAAGQVLDNSTVLYLVNRSPVALAEEQTVQFVPRLLLDRSTSRGPPVFAF